MAQQLIQAALIAHDTCTMQNFSVQVDLIGVTRLAMKCFAMLDVPFF